MNGLFVHSKRNNPSVFSMSLPLPASPIYPETTLSALLASRIEGCADHTALRCGDLRLSYHDLGRRAHRLARLLISRGIGPDDIVPIAFDSSVERIIAMLGILLAGGAYLPLDVEAPPARNEDLIVHSQATLVLTCNRFKDALNVQARSIVLSLDAPETLSDLSVRNDAPIDPSELRAQITPDRLAYVIYTSGSTGKPKGVCVSHGAIATSLDWITNTLGVTAADIAIHRTEYTFDVSVWEIFSILTTGGTLVVLKPGEALDSTCVEECAREFAVSLLFFTPTMLTEFIEVVGAAGNASIRNIVTIGEAMPGLLQQKTHEKLPRAILWNAYGPTEAAVGVTLWRCRREDGAKAPPIGFSAPNTEIYLLDESLKPVANGKAGELFIAGDYLADGYLGMPELTAEKFIPCPFGTPSERMYRTGDLAERRGDGEIYFLGRNDSQIKFNGIRVELGEIQAALLTIPGVIRAAVVPRVMGDENRLIAYVIMEAGARPLIASEAKAALGVRLPRYLIPSFFVTLDAFPLTTSGKLDTKALRDPDGSDERAPYREPSGELETFFTQTFAELLGVSRVGADDSFFDLGGTSLTAMRVASRARAKTGLVMPMRALVERPTPAGLASVMSLLKAGEDTFTLLPFDSRPVVFVLPGVGGSDISLASVVVACDPFLDMRVLDYPEWRSLCAPGTTFEGLAASLGRKIVAAAPKAEINLLGYSLGGDLAYALAHYLRGLGRRVNFVGVIDMEAPSFRAGPRPSLVAKARRRWNLVARIIRDHEVTLALTTNTLGRVPPRALPTLASALSIGSAKRRERVEGRMTVTIGMQLRAKWLRTVKGYPRLEAPTYLFRVEPNSLDEARFNGWGERCASLQTFFVGGSHLTVLSNLNRSSFVETFLASTREALRRPSDIKGVEGAAH